MEEAGEENLIVGTFSGTMRFMLQITRCGTLLFTGSIGQVKDWEVFYCSSHVMIFLEQRQALLHLHLCLPPPAETIPLILLILLLLFTVSPPFCKKKPKLMFLTKHKKGKWHAKYDFYTFLPSNNEPLLFVAECDGAVQPKPEEPGQPWEELREICLR